MWILDLPISYSMPAFRLNSQLAIQTYKEKYSAADKNHIFTKNSVINSNL